MRPTHLTARYAFQDTTHWYRPRHILYKVESAVGQGLGAALPLLRPGLPCPGATPTTFKTTREISQQYTGEKAATCLTQMNPSPQRRGLSSKQRRLCRA